MYIIMIATLVMIAVFIFVQKQQRKTR